MTDYALVIDGRIERLGVPPSARRLDTGGWVLGLPDAPDDLKAACGFMPVQDTPKPDDTALTTFGRSVELVGGAPVVVWVERPKSPAELGALSADEKLELVKAKLAELESLPAPLLTADLVDILTEIQGAI